MRIGCRLAVALTATIALTSTSFGQACNTAGRPALLILDASGSMNARLPNGETRIDVARRAVKGVASFLPADAPMSLRLYGAQSPKAAKNCSDTNLAVPFAPASQNSAAITASVDGAVAQGYTPIAYALREAANDFPAGANERVIVVVSDGKETCQGDPCAVAKAMAADGFVIHTVGFVVDTAARAELQCIARVTGGSYFDAPVGPELPDMLNSAFAACAKKVVVLPKKPKPGKLRTTSAVFSHEVFNAETGEQVGTLDRVTHELTLPAGIYEVKFGPASWKGIEVHPGETTTIEPGLLRVEPNISAEVVDSETGELFGQFDAVTPELTLLPGVYDLRFGTTEWRYVKVDGGQTTVLKPVQVKLARDLDWSEARVTTTDGTEIFRFDAVTWNATLPPGDYVVEVDGKTIPFPAAAGDVLEVAPQ